MIDNFPRNRSIILGKNRIAITDNQEDCDVIVFQFMDEFLMVSEYKITKFREFYRFFKTKASFLINNVKFHLEF